MRDNFVFYKSFYIAALQAPTFEMQKDILWYLVECCLDVKTYSDVPFPSSSVVVPVIESVNTARRRYEKTVEKGKQGGRPKKWIEQENAEKLFLELGSWEAVAEKLEVSVETLRKARFKWYGDESKKPKNQVQKTQNPKNLTDTVTDTVTDTETVTVTVTNKNEEINNRANGAAGTYVPPRVSERKLAERKIQPSKEETIALLRSLQEEREKERRENEDRREGGTG